ncbi:MAG TPA: LysM domain-containing protein [Ilumatobacteraceae bacterium]|nr:LysM domain-containing protein [Ilumatobacteraceae bacterium]
MAIAVVIPHRLADTQVYARRRLRVLFVLAAIVLVLLVSTGHVVANRGGAPASTPAIRLANAAATGSVDTTYVVQAGDTLWSIGQRFHGHTALAEYVDALVAANGGSQIQVAQALALP